MLRPLHSKACGRGIGDERLAAMRSHIPNRGEQMVRYYGYYSNVTRGKRKKAGMKDKDWKPGRSFPICIVMFRYYFMLILLVGMMVGSALGKEQDTVDLTAYQWKNRLLIVFAPSEDAPIYQSFKELLQRRIQEIRDRDLLVLHVPETGEGWLAHLPLNKGQVLFLRKKFSILPGQLIVILIGKDGEVKLRGELPRGLSEIFSVIDEMPMRQREMREGSE